MEPQHFDGLARSAAHFPTRRALLSLAFGGALAWLRRGEVEAKKGHGRSGKGKSSHKPKTVTICHLGQTIRVKKGKALIHLRHGDTLGECPAPPSPPPPPPPPPPAPVCSGVTEACTDNADCCSQLCSAIDVCICLVRGTQCTIDATCCSGTCNAATNTCTCQPQGAVCTESAQCCDTLACLNIGGELNLGTCLP
jgi:hypothetical protein